MRRIGRLANHSILAGTLMLGATALGSAAGVTGALKIHDEAQASGHVVDQNYRPVVVPPRGNVGLADLVQAVLPAVVQVQVRQTATPSVTGFPFAGQPFGEMFREFFGEASPPIVAEAVGSGFIIDPSGVIVTNDHVVDGAEKIRVKLADGRELPATLVGRDDKTDLAVLRIKGGGRYPAIQWGDSSHLRVGDSVFAVGSPFGLGSTVTSGIISGQGREIGQGPYDDFLQVDAAINQGNSGGPLFDNSDRVVGVNTAIYSPSGGSVGIGFAIPAQLAQSVVQQIVAKGAVARGQIGVQVQAVTPEIADSLGLREARGALVVDVNDDSPAARGGLKAGDIITAFNGHAIDDARTLSRDVASTPAGRTVPVTVRRDGKALTLSVAVAALPDATADRSARPMPSDAADGAHTLLGLTVAPTNADLNAQAGQPSASRGLMVLDVDQASDSAERGIRPGDLIVAVNTDRIDTTAALAAAVDAAKQHGRHNVLLDVRRGTQHALIPIGVA